MNALLGEKLSITTSKSQTTRHRIMGIFSGEDFQIVYSDTPGIVNPHYKLHQSMMNFVSSALEDADIFLLVTEVGETLKNYETLEKVISSNVPVILVINKIDISNQDFVKSKIDYWQKEIPRSIIIPTSATQGFNLDVLFNKILELLPENPPYFSKDEITDKSMRFFASEIIREKLLINYKKEVPYSSEVVIEDYKEERNIDKIFAVIYVERESQKAIIIGHQGEALKRLGTQSRIDIERFTSKKCYLDLRIKVKNNWRNDTQTLKQFGY
jgi:GTP-binding protein Era